uniref:Histidine kinase/HSP90-like ATPase domain-containing protein n=1 Tax=Oryctolagus cuniculus TaxID=9986 RepID=A0A5F9CJJ5_RABIT
MRGSGTQPAPREKREWEEPALSAPGQCSVCTLVHAHPESGPVSPGSPARVRALPSPFPKCRSHSHLVLSVFSGGSVLCPRRTALQSPGPRRHLAWSAPSGRRLSTRAAQGEDEERPRAGVRSTESVHGSVSKHEFQAETKKLLDIVARSLYSEKEVFIRELISNASDALEKLRHKLVSGGQALPDMEIHLQTDAEKGTITIQDSGIGMTREELVSNLGTIARSGSKAFLEALQSQAEASSRIIGQFGVGFYSAFMVADRVEVYSRPAAPESQGHQWLSDGSGVFEVAEASGVKTGTKIILHLKPDCKAFSDEARVRDVVTKYSNFVSFPLYLNGKRINTLQAIWMMDPKGVSEEQHEEFYRYIAQAYDKPRYTLHYKTDAPLNIRSLFYVPETKPSMFDVSRELGSSVALYSRKVLIQTKATDVLPKWLRFVRGVVDSEDIPLNLSRELLQESRRLPETLGCSQPCPRLGVRRADSRMGSVCGVGLQVVPLAPSAVKCRCSRELMLLPKLQVCPSPQVPPGAWAEAQHLHPVPHSPAPPHCPEQTQPRGLSCFL